MLDGEVITDPPSRRCGSAGAWGWSSRRSTCSRTSPCSRTCARPDPGARRARREAEDHARELLARVGLEGREGDYPDHLSGGQQQRVAIVRALATRPRALLLDEVTSALDPELVGEVLGGRPRLKEEGMTMVIATHEMGFARDVADQVCFLHEGRVLERGEPDRIFRAPERPETRQFLRRIIEAR